MRSSTFHLVWVMFVIVCTAPRRSMLMPGGPGPAMQYQITSARLVGPQLSRDHAHSGRVQVQIDGTTWLDVCENMWDDGDGEVACRQVGYAGLLDSMRGIRIDEANQTSESVRDFRCAGEESSLAQCDHNKRGRCMNGAGITCYEITSVRLVGPQLRDQPHSGRVQVQIDSTTWLDVCENMWDDEDGEVVCRQVGYAGLLNSMRGIGIDANNRTSESVRDFRCDGEESSLAQCDHNKRRGCMNGAGVICYDIGQETEATTIERVVTPEQTTPGPANTSPVTSSMWTVTERPENPGLTQSATDGHGMTTKLATTDTGGLDSQRESKPGKYIGLALGCTVFIVCACFMVVCLLRRYRQRKLPVATTDLQLSVGFEQCRSDNEKVLGLAVPCPSPVEHSLKQPASAPPVSRNESASKISVYLELNGEMASGKRSSTEGKQNTARASCFTTKQSESDAMETNQVLSCGTDYFTVEDKGDLTGNGQYTTGVVGDKATSQAVDAPSRDSGLPGEDDVDDHEYTYADPISGSTAHAEGEPGSHNVLHPPVYTYADVPRLGAPATGIDRPPNADYFMIEEQENSMGAPLYNAGEARPTISTKETKNAGCQPAAMNRETEYATADDSNLCTGSAEETEGWVENIVYVPGPPE
ncbi:uncharacterized protein LOC110980363 [Acanthaster planci]|uniref:Uncharacterized protein LOC110980363 n=1 Tax=Acanthaster planci TaxID=133434 RepID=A0A8B7YMG9_ACAPL|nr:uncharacterized protein LOC110980363 [Acanthaster planci]